MKAYHLVPALLAAAAASPAAGSNFTCVDDPEQLVCLPRAYDQHQAPLQYGVTSVGVDFDVEEVAEVGDGWLTLVGYLNLKWKESRIVRRRGFGARSRTTGNYPNYVKVPEAMLDSLWKPNAYIYGLKDFSVPKLLEPLSGLWIATDSTVLYSQFASVTVRCPMPLARFPLDSHECVFRLGSYSYDAKRMVFAAGGMGWFQGRRGKTATPFSVDLEKLPEDELMLDFGTLGNFSTVGLRVTLTRNWTPYLATYYVPSAAAVALSWASFLIPPNRIPSRFSFLAILLLVNSCLAGFAASATPGGGSGADSLTCLQVWLLSCTCFLLAPCVEFVVLLLRQRRGRQRVVSMVRRQARYEAAANPGNNGDAGEKDAAAAGDDEGDDEDFWRYDRLYMCLFPALFLGFNLVYWLAYAV